MGNYKSSGKKLDHKLVNSILWNIDILADLAYVIQIIA